MKTWIDFYNEALAENLPKDRLADRMFELLKGDREAYESLIEESMRDSCRRFVNQRSAEDRRRCKGLEYNKGNHRVIANVSKAQSKQEPFDYSKARADHYRLLDMMVPYKDKRLADAKRSDLLEAVSKHVAQAKGLTDASRFYKILADGLQGDETVSEKFDEEAVRRIHEEVRAS